MRRRSLCRDGTAQRVGRGRSRRQCGREQLRARQAQELPGHHRRHDEQADHVERDHRTRQSPLRRTESRDQHGERVGDAGNDDEAAQAPPPFHEVGTPVRSGRGSRQTGKEEWRAALKAQGHLRQGQTAAVEDGAVQSAHDRHQQPGHEVDRTQAELVVEEGLHEDPEQDRVADRHGDERRLPEARHGGFEPRRRADDLHDQAEGHRHAGTRGRQARPVAQQHRGQQQQQRDQRAAQGRVEQGRELRVGHRLRGEARHDSRVGARSVKLVASARARGKRRGLGCLPGRRTRWREPIRRGARACVML